MTNEPPLYAHERRLAQGQRHLPQTLRRAINVHCHKLAVELEAVQRQQMLDQARQMLTDGLIQDDVLAALGIE
jgi:hypothetical protein